MLNHSLLKYNWQYKSAREINNTLKLEREVTFMTDDAITVTMNIQFNTNWIEYNKIKWCTNIAILKCYINYQWNTFQFRLYHSPEVQIVPYPLKEQMGKGKLLILGYYLLSLVLLTILRFKLDCNIHITEFWPWQKNILNP